jgi:hypothetical protein
MPARIKRIERWSEEDEQLLRQMSDNGKSLTLMTVKLKKSMASIKSRAEDLHIPIPGTEIGKRWKHRQVVKST